jgi:hypothetical protein
MHNIQERQETSNACSYETKEYDHYVAVDWSMKTMAIVRMTNKSSKVSVIEQPSDIEELKTYFMSSRLKNAGMSIEKNVKRKKYTVPVFRTGNSLTFGLNFQLLVSPIKHSE